MATIRFSGKGSVRLTIDESINAYRVSVSDGARRVRFTVRFPAVLQGAIDAPEVLDAAARSAIAFATDPDSAREMATDPLDADAFASDGSGWHVGRSRAAAYPALANAS